MDILSEHTPSPAAFTNTAASPRRASILPAAFDSALNRQLESLGISHITANGPSHAASTSTLPDDDDDDELPRYDELEGLQESSTSIPGALPTYEERQHHHPTVCYTIYQISRKLQVLTPATRASSFSRRPRYRVAARSGLSLLSKKADFTLTRLPTGAAAAAAAVESTPGTDVGFVNFDRSGTIPWQPRASVRVAVAAENAISNTSASSMSTSTTSNSTSTVTSSSSGGGGGGGTCKMAIFPMNAPNFSDWHIRIDSQPYHWRLTYPPTALSLMVEHNSRSDDINNIPVVARLVYSAQGTDATRGAAVGVLEIFGGSCSGEMEMELETERVELLLCSVLVPLKYWKSLGRHHRNDVVPRTCVGANAGAVAAMAGNMGSCFSVSEEERRRARASTSESAAGRTFRSARDAG